MEGEDSADGGLMSPEELKDYCAKVRDTAVWGGEPEITALANAYNVPIHVIQAATPHVVPHNPSGNPPPPDDSRVLRISYHRRMYGLGEVSTLPFLVNMCVFISRVALQLSAAEASHGLRRRLQVHLHGVLASTTGHRITTLRVPPSPRISPHLPGADST